MRASFFLATFVLILMGSVVHAQQPQSPPPLESKPSPSPTPSSAKEKKAGDYIHIQELQTVIRYNYQDRAPGNIADRDLQYRIRLKAQVDLVPSGHSSIRLRAETGKGFDNSFDNTGIGRGRRAWHFNVKTLAFVQKLGSHVTTEVGGLEFDPGAGSQVTYASGDGYFVGYRFVYSAPEIKKVSVTAGFIGDFDQPNVFRRFHLGKMNYVQVLGQKEFANGLEASAEFDSIRDVQFTLQAFRWKKVPGRVVDEARLELVERLNHQARFGWALILDRSLDKDKRWNARLIYSDIPFNLYRKNGVQILQNQGETDKGKRLNGGLSYKFARDWEAGIFGGRRLDSTPGKRWVAQTYVSYDFARVLNNLLHGSSASK
jgi:hypothetical protein